MYSSCRISLIIAAQYLKFAISARTGSSYIPHIRVGGTRCFRRVVGRGTQASQLHSEAFAGVSAEKEIAIHTTAPPKLDASAVLFEIQKLKRGGRMQDGPLRPPLLITGFLPLLITYTLVLTSTSADFCRSRRMIVAVSPRVMLSWPQIIPALLP